MRQDPCFPELSTTTLTVATAKPWNLAMQLRISAWTNASSAKINGHAIYVTPTPGNSLTLNRVWKAGDKIELTMPMHLSVEAMPYDPKTQAFLYGPLVLAAEEWAQANGKEALAEIVAHAQSANDFAYLATTPASAAKKALEKAGLQPGDIDLWEINEAFASVPIAACREYGLDEDRVNIYGSGCSLGHPIAASGARARYLGRMWLSARWRTLTG